MKNLDQLNMPSEKDALKTTWYYVGQDNEIYG